MYAVVVVVNFFVAVGGGLIFSTANFTTNWRRCSLWCNPILRFVYSNGKAVA